jgi:hypothetical protein
MLGVDDTIGARSTDDGAAEHMCRRGDVRERLGQRALRRPTRLLGDPRSRLVIHSSLLEKNSRC